MHNKIKEIYKGFSFFFCCVFFFVFFLLFLVYFFLWVCFCCFVGFFLEPSRVAWVGSGMDSGMDSWDGFLDPGVALGVSPAQMMPLGGPQMGPKSTPFFM